MFKTLYSFKNNLWKYVANMYTYFDKNKKPYVLTTKRPGRACINNRNIFIPKGTRIIYPVDREGNYSNE